MKSWNYAVRLICVAAAVQALMGYLKKRLLPPDFLLAFTIIVQAISNLKVEDRMRGLAPNLSPLGLHLAWLVAKFICSNLASFLHLASWLGEGASCLPLGTYMAGELLLG